MKKVVILINAMGPDATPDELDVLNQAGAVEVALHNLGHDTERVFLEMNLEKAAERLRQLRPEFVFNLVESIDGSGKLIHLAPSLLEHLGIPYTGVRSEAMYVSSNKTLAKLMLRQAKLPTPQWIDDLKHARLKKNTRYIAKPVWEDASVGITDSSVMPGDKKLLSAFLESNSRYRYFFEEYIEGREFNISILGGKKGPEVLPIAEIVFRDYPEGKPLIVGYEAKWHEDSFEYSNTVRSFGLEKEDPGLARALEKICRQCWALFGLTGYSRVDFRVDGQGRPYVLEVNANPCLSPDAGFYAASEQAGYNFNTIVERICEDVWR
ncbi:MAG: ATP-grasp domain-containing protein [Bacteroidales bacterium]|jgi:D-alanine-D-alanine ligase|nr:ATP-grasp domain-containing protein [Bacteroidales bacterium]